MTTEQFFSLKSQVRLKRYPWFTVILDRMIGGQSRVQPLQAVVLAMCTGFYNRADMSLALNKGIGLELQKADETIDTTLDEFATFLDIYDTSAERSLLYDPTDFLYEPEPLPDDTSEPHFPTPLEIVVSLTHKCNLRCIYCFNNAAEPIPNEMTTADILSAVDQAIDLNILRCTITGGEPTLHEAFFPIVKKLLEADIFPLIATNGTTLDFAGIKKLVDLGLPYIQVSLDAATSEMHDRLVIVPKTFDKVLKTISTFSSLGVHVRVKSVITPLNYREVPQLIALCQDLGVKNLFLDQFDLSYTGRGNDKLYLNQEESDWVNQQVQAYLSPNMTVGWVKMRRKWQSQEDTIRCGGLTTALTITPNGDVGLCEKLLNVTQFQEGNIRDKPLKELWESRKVDRVCRPPKETFPEPCASCEHFENCGSGCFAHKLLFTDNILAPDPRCWKANFPTERISSH